MTREEYMTKLQKYLRKLPKQDYEDAIEYFNEYFSDTDEEGQQRLMEELGTPKEAAADLMYNLLDRKIQEQDESGEEKKSKKGNFNIIVTYAKDGQSFQSIAENIIIRKINETN